MLNLLYMRKIVPILMLICLQTNAQTVFTENFNNYPVNTVSNNITGSAYGIGNWYTKNILFNGVTNNGNTSDYKIVAEPLKGNILQLEVIKGYGIWNRHMYRNDLTPLFAQRNNTNKILKISFDYFFGKKIKGYSAGVPASTTFFMLRNNKENLVSVACYPANAIGAYLPIQRNNTTLVGLTGVKSYGFRDPKNISQSLEIPENTWVTIEIYLDYNTSKMYFSLPAYNCTFVTDASFKLELDGVEHDDTPYQFDIIKGNVNFGGPEDLVSKIDNINFSAQSTPPVVTLGVNEVLNESFSVYPNPTNGIVTISNTENLQVERVVVFDVSGKEVYASNTINNSQINIENFASGTYMLHIQTKEGTAVKKIVKQ